MADAQSVVQWITVTGRWLGHRPEPLICERLWGCPLEVEDGARDEDGTLHQAGFDASGRPVVVRHEYLAGGRSEAWSETVSYGPGRVEVHFGAGRVVTTFDDDGRALQSVYRDEVDAPDVETYVYDSDGRLVTIDEATMLGATAQGGRGYGWPTGDLLAVDHDERGLREIVVEESGAAVWRRVDERWADLLERCVSSMAAEAVEWITTAYRRRSEDDQPAVLALALCSTSGMGLGCMGRLILDVSDPRAEAEAAAHPHVYDVLTGRTQSSIYLDAVVEMETDLESRLMQQASYSQPRDPCRFVLSAVASRLARHDWSGVFPAAEEFVVFLDEHDRGAEAMWASVRAVNPPERVARWGARWRTP